MKKNFFVVVFLMFLVALSSCFGDDSDNDSISYPSLDGKSFKANFTLDGTSITFINDTVGFIVDPANSSIVMAGSNLSGVNSSLGAYVDEFYMYIPDSMVVGKTYTMSDAGTGLIYFNSSGVKYRSINFAGSPDPPEADTAGYDLRITIGGISGDEMVGTFSGHLHGYFYDPSTGYSYLKKVSIANGSFRANISAVLH